MVIVSADDQASLGVEHLAIDEKVLNGAMQAGLEDDPFAIALTGVLRKASASNIAVRLSMLPPWLRERPQLGAAIRTAASGSENDGNWLAVAPYPKRAAWYAQIRVEDFVFLDPPESFFLADAGWSRASELPREAQRTCCVEVTRRDRVASTEYASERTRSSICGFLSTRRLRGFPSQECASAP